MKYQKEYSNMDIIERKEKRRRRTALEIERKYQCRYEGCPKSYGSEGSLNQHMKNKHSEFYQQFMDNLNLSGGVIDQSRDFGSCSNSSYSGDESNSKSYDNKKQSESESVHSHQKGKRKAEEDTVKKAKDHDN